MSKLFSKPEVVITELAYKKIMHWVDISPIEVSGLGKVIFEDNQFIITDAFLVKQKNTESSTEMDGASIAKLMYETKDIPGHLNFWWHSHVNMGAFWSGTDYQTIQDLSANGFLVATVFNKKRDMRSAIRYKSTEIMPDLFLDEISTRVESRLEQSLYDSLTQEFNEKCERQSWRESRWPEWTYHREAIQHEDYELLNWEYINQKCLEIEKEQNQTIALDLVREAYRMIKEMKVEKLVKKAMREELEVIYKESRKLWNNNTSSVSKISFQQ